MVAVNNKVHDIDLPYLTYSQKSVIGSVVICLEEVCLCSEYYEKW